MSGFSVADLIKPTLETLNSSEENEFIKETKKRNIDEKIPCQNINISYNKHDRLINIDTLNTFEQNQHLMHKINPIKNDNVKKSRIEINYTTKLSNQTTNESLMNSSEIITTSLQSNSQIKLNANNVINSNENNHKTTDTIPQLSSPTLSKQSFNSVSNLSKEELTIQSIIKTNLKESFFPKSSQSILMNDLTLLPNVISSPPTTSSSSSPLFSFTNSTPIESNSEEQLQILLKLHNLFGITSTNKSILNNINLTNSIPVENSLNDRFFLNNIVTNSNSSTLGQNNAEVIVPLNSSYMMSIMMNHILNKEPLEDLNFAVPPSSLYYQPYLPYSHHQTSAEQQQQQPQSKQHEPQQLRHQQLNELNSSELTELSRNRLIANFLKSRFLWDSNNNCEQNIFHDFNEIANKFDHSNITLSNYDNFIKNSLSHNVLLTSDSRKPKRIRTAFSPAQLFQLESAFEKNHYVIGQERKDLATDLNLTETQVKVWFQNRRTKYKRLRTDGKDVLSDSNSKDQRSLSDGEVDEDSDDDDNDEDGDDNNHINNHSHNREFDKEQKDDHFSMESIHQNQANSKFNNEPFQKQSISESSKGIHVNTSSIYSPYLITENQQFHTSKECQPLLYNSKSNPILGGQNTTTNNNSNNNNNDNLAEKSKFKTDYTNYTWNSFKQSQEHVTTDIEIEQQQQHQQQQQQEQQQTSILHSSQHLIHSLVGHINQNLQNHLQHSCRQTL
ncbi:unnamed protein product [Schistosoma turkestanicum]|nr:unnamed protein product [Schistosoma turkestanicum]